MGFSALKQPPNVGSLNPFSTIDFGLLAGLRHAHNWQARHCSLRRQGGGPQLREARNSNSGPWSFGPAG